MASPPETTAEPIHELAPEELAAWRGLLRVHSALVKALDAELLAGHELPLTSYEVLINLQAAPGRRRRMAELADGVLLSRSGMTRLVDRLERDGLLERDPCTDDGRGTYAVLTDKGAALLAPGAPDPFRRRARPLPAPFRAGRAAHARGLWEPGPAGFRRS